MLYLEIPEQELFDGTTSTFIYTKKEVLQLEHSLVSLSKWESNWCKPFLSQEEKTKEEVIDYVKCMTITQNVNPEVYNRIPNEQLAQIDEYINCKMTATWFKEEQPTTTKKEIITAEIIYYWMIAQNIPMECQKWHLNRLLTLIRVCNIKNQPPKKRDARSSMSQRAALNQARKAKYNTRG